MVLSMCTQLYIEVMVKLIKLLFWDHIAYTIFVLFIFYWLHKSPMLSGGFAFVINFLGDSLGGWGILKIGWGFLPKLGILAILSPLLGLIWVGMILLSPGNLILKIICAPIAFMAGFLQGVFPIPIPISPVLAFAMSDRHSANITMTLMIGATLFIMLTFGSWFCGYLDAAIAFFL